MGVLTGKVALVTGSGSGIGAAIAIEFARVGADIVLNHLQDSDGVKKTEDAVRAEGRRVLVVEGDVGDEAAVTSMFRSAVNELDRVDILVNNAGVDASGTKLVDLEVKDLEASLRTNFFGPFLCCREFVRLRHSLGVGGKIVNISSIHEEVARSGATDYCSGKGALRNLTRCLALEVAEDSITVNNIAPGMVLTQFNQKAIDDPNELAEETKTIPMKRAAEPSEIARLAVFLASDDSNYVTGATYVMDGGLMQNQGQGA